MREQISILGSTGSIGRSTLEVIREHPENFEVVALAAGTNIESMIQQAVEFRPRMIAMATREAADAVKKEVDEKTVVLSGQQGMMEVAQHERATYIVSAMVGSRGLPPTLAAIEAGKKIGLANKETLVTAGHIVIEAAEKNNVALIPIDSEHSAIYQCLNGESPKDVNRLILTGSGGSFRDLSRDQLTDVSVEQALNHPNWAMGPKITIDSATMMNKGLEVIEARWLFGFDYDKIDVILHAQSIIHSMVEFVDGSIMAQLGTPDMKVPIQYALTTPHRARLTDSKLDFSTLSQLDFRPLDFTRYPCIRMAYEAGKSGDSFPTVLNAANEQAVALFLNRSIPFLAIEEMVERALSAHRPFINPGLEEIEYVDQWARKFVQSQL